MAKPLKKVARKLRGVADEVGLTTPKPIARRTQAKKPVKRKK